MSAQLAQSFYPELQIDNDPDWMSPFILNDVFASMNKTLSHYIKTGIAVCDSTYETEIRPIQDYESLHGRLYYVINVIKQKIKPNRKWWDKKEDCQFIFTLHSKEIPPEGNIQYLIDEFRELIKDLPQKVVLAEMLFDSYGIHINEDMKGVNIETRVNNDKVEYKFNKTNI